MPNQFLQIQPQEIFEFLADEGHVQNIDIFELVRKEVQREVPELKEQFVQKFHDEQCEIAELSLTEQIIWIIAAGMTKNNLRQFLKNQKLHQSTIDKKHKVILKKNMINNNIKIKKIQKHNAELDKGCQGQTKQI